MSEDAVRESPLRRVTVLGAGSWGTTFAKILADAGREVTLWARREEIANEINTFHTNRAYLSDVLLPSELTATCDAERALVGAEAVFLAVPSQSLRANLTSWRSIWPSDAIVVSLAKGVELGTLKRMSEVIIDVLGVSESQVAVISGPNLTSEIAHSQPSATVVACTDHEHAVAIQQACSTRYFRPYTNTDVVGCELAGACKNVIALSCGVAAGLGLGTNTMAALITRGLAEMARLGAKLGADPLTFAGLAGVGDLVATCSSTLSRNRTFGERLGRGETLAQAQHAVGGQVAEGVMSCSSIKELARVAGVDMPLTEAMHMLCHEGGDPRAVGAQLLDREHKHEWL